MYFKKNFNFFFFKVYKSTRPSVKPVYRNDLQISQNFFSVVKSKRIQSIDDFKREEDKGYLKYVLKYKTYYIIGCVFILPYSKFILFRMVIFR